MAEIGAKLREARMSAGLDIAEVEAKTKIRAKYLRALENDEWGLLPGPVYIANFLRTYAQLLGLDPRRIVDEFKEDYARRLGRSEVLSIGSPLGVKENQGRRSNGGRRSLSPLLIVALAVVTVLGFFFLLGLRGEEEDSRKTERQESQTAVPESSDMQSQTQETDKQSKRTVRRIKLSLKAREPVQVCLEDRTANRRLIDGRVLQPTESKVRVFRVNPKHKLYLSVNSSNLYLKWNGRRARLLNGPATYALTDRGVRTARVAASATCR